MADETIKQKLDRVKRRKKAVEDKKVPAGAQTGATATAPAGKATSGLRQVLKGSHPAPGTGAVPRG